MKRLIICNDGTWDKPGAISKDGKPLDSNVCLLYQAVAKEGIDGVPQLKIYDTGVGTSYSLKDKLGGGILGMGIDKKIKDLYTFLVLNYAKGDEIYLFGFSRGAYTVRSLSGLIRNCGVLKPEYLNFVDKAYELYRNKNDYSKPDDDMMLAFRRNYCIDDNITRIKFIGVWDSVGSLGIPLPAWKMYNIERYKFHDVTLSSTVDYAYHALAVDERRKPFAPTLWKASNSTKGKNIDIEQRWFSGVHANIGGGYADRGLSNKALKWMIEKAMVVGLTFDKEQLKDMNLQCKDVLENSYTYSYWLTGKIWRTINDPEYANQTMDPSVEERLLTDSNYRPENLKKFYSSLYDKK
ncbi:MAG: DUF2235 domain-containing protein [Flavobacterium sp.]|nr:DUF2235 domain-containing protein [Flavobacterium sp.]